MTRAFWLDAAERAIKTFAQTLLALWGVDALDLREAAVGDSLWIALSAVVLSLLSSLVSLRLGNSGTASATEAVVPAPEA